MGTIQHDVIIVTEQAYPDDDDFKALHEEAKRIFPVVSDILHSGMNGYLTFFIPPDGSKEMWMDSNLGDERRKEFLSKAGKRLLSEVISVSYGELGYSIDRIFDITDFGKNKENA